MIERLLVPVVQRAYEDPFTTKSDFAREHASLVAMAACEGLITTKLTNKVYCAIWRPTADGIKLLERYNVEMD